MVGTSVMPDDPVPGVAREERHPVFLVLAGMPSVVNFTNDRTGDSGSQLARRCTHVLVPTELLRSLRARANVAHAAEVPEVASALLLPD